MKQSSSIILGIHKRHTIAILVLFVLGVGFFFYSLNLPFFSDDFTVIHRIASGKMDQGIFMRPLGDLSLWIDFKLFGFDEFYFHLHSVLLHIVASCLIFVFVEELFSYLHFAERGREQICWIAAIIFLLFPFHNETIVWIVGRGILLSSIWVLISLIIFLRYGNKNTGYIAALIAMAIACMGYETAFILPLFIFIISYYKYRSLAKAFSKAEGFIIILLVVFYWRKFYLGNIFGDDYYRLNFKIGTYLYNYAALLLRSFSPPFEQSLIFVITGILALLVILMSIIWIWRRRNAVLFQTVLLFALFMSALLPVATVGIDTHDFEGGRFLYQASIFIAVFLAALIVYTWRSRSGFTIALILVGVYFLCFHFKIAKEWNVAGTKVRAITETKVQFTHKNLFINIPDSYGGAYIFRNGLREALLLNNKISGKDSIIKLNPLSEGSALDNFKRMSMPVLEKLYGEQKVFLFADTLSQRYPAKDYDK